MMQTEATPAANSQKLDSIDHVAITVENVQAAVDWYTANFSCTILYQDDTWAFLEFSNMKLALVVPRQHPPHVAFTHPQAEKFGKLKQHRDGTRSVYIRDPSGNSVEIQAKD
jgi:catechol 2,3-dioxygenase-like lactoylglutathione lyase family enzyme